MSLSAIKSQTKTRCAFCSREVVKPHHVVGLGDLGPECYSKVRGLEPLLAQAPTWIGTRPTLESIMRSLKRLGLSYKLEDAGEDERSFSLFRVRVTGVKSSPTFAQARAAYAADLERLQAA